MTRLDQVIAGARERLGQKRRYAADVLAGERSWSGSDLQGKAKEYGAHYAKQRKLAEAALRAAGGDLVSLQPSGRIVAAVAVCVDDYGSRVYQSTAGLVVQDTARRVREVRS